MVANGIVPCHIDVMMMQLLQLVGSHRSEPQRLRAQNIWCRYFSPCSRFQLMVYSWRCSKTWVDYDTDQFGPPWKVVPWPVVGRHRPAWRKSAADVAGLNAPGHSPQCTVQRAHNWALHLLDCSIMSSKLRWVHQCQTYSSKRSRRRGSVAERAQKKFFCSGVRTVLRAKPILTLSKDLQWTKHILSQMKNCIPNS